MTSTSPPTANTFTQAATIRHSIQPWWPTFLSPSSFSLPLSLPGLSLRFNNNLYTFRANYAIISILIFLLSLIFHPFTAVIFFVIVSTWTYLVFARDEPLVLFDFEIGDRVVVIVLSVVTIVAVAVSRVWWNLFVSGLVACLVVSLHAILRSSEGDGGESPYGALLSGIDDEDEGGLYMPV